MSRERWHIDDEKAVGKRLKEAREDAGLAQRELAFEGCTAVYICRIERGDRVPSLQVIHRLAARLGVTAEWLAHGKEPKRVDPWQEPAAMTWVEHIISDMAPKIESSAFVVSLVPDLAKQDVKFWVELGASIMMDKPIIAVMLGNEAVPPKLLAIADEIVVLPKGVNAEGSEELVAAIRRVAGTMEGSKP